MDAEKAAAEGWWYKPPYIINELNINSAVVYPRHGEVVSEAPFQLTARVSILFGGFSMGRLVKALEPLISML